MHHEPLGSRADIVERIAGHERDSVRGRGVKDPNVLRIDDPHPVDHVVRKTICRLNLNLIADVRIFQGAEVSIAMSGNSYVSALPWQDRPFDMSNTE